MKILVTGTNNYHAKRDTHLSTRSKYRLVTATTGLVAALEDMGYKVDQRYVTPGEDLSDYDKVFVTYFDVLGGMQPGGYGAWWTFQQRKDAIVVIDDWATPKRLLKHYQKTWEPEKLHEALFREYMVGSQRKESRFAAEDEFLQKALKEGFSENIFDTRKILYCAFDKFNVNKIFDYPHNAYSFNPEVYVPSPQDRLDEMGLERKERERKWVIAGIGGLPTQKACKFKDIFESPVEVYGRETIDKDATLAKEPEIIQAYSGATFVFYPDQGNFGANWWRNRPRQCADMGAVLFMQNDEEAALFGPSYQGLTIEGLEAMSLNAIENLAQRQKEDYYKSNPLDKESVKKSLQSVLS